MSEPVYLLLAVALVAAYLMLTSGGGSPRRTVRSEEIDRLARTTEQAMEHQFQLGKQRIDAATRRRQS